MEPLTAQQEQLLVSDNQNVQDQDEEHEDEDKQSKLENLDPENEISADRISPSDSERNRSGDATAPQYAQQEELQEQSDVDDTLVSNNTSLSSELLPKSEIVNASVASQNTESYSSLDNSVVDSTHVHKKNLVNDYTTHESLNNDMADLKEDGKLKDASPNSSDQDAGSNSSDQSGSFDHFAGGYVDTTTEAQLVSENEISEMARLVESTHEQGILPEISVEGMSSALELQNRGEPHSFGAVSVSAPAYTLADEPVKNGHGETNAGKSISESPKSSNIFTSAGIPAPSVVSEAVRVTPGKILVPPAVDQVQWQALAALQTMKVLIH